MIVLHWQVPKWLSGTSLVTRVIIGSSVLHLCALIAIFVVYQGSSQFNITISGNMINPNSEIVFMPLHRSIKQPTGAKSVGGGQSKASAKSNIAQVEKAIDAGGTTLVKIVQPKAKPKLSKKEAKKAEAKKALDAKNEKATQPTPKASDSAKATTDKTAGKEKDAAAKKELACFDRLSTNGGKCEKAEPKAESKQVQPPVQEKSSEAKENINNSSASSTATDGAIDTRAIDGVVYVGQAEMDALQAQDYIQQELAQHWAPPSGMRSDLFAIVTLTIDFEGAIKKIDLATSSGNLLFDTAAKKAAAQITPARWTFGKELSITFKP